MGCTHLMLTRLNMFAYVTVGQAIISIVEEARIFICLEWLGVGGNQHSGTPQFMLGRLPFISMSQRIFRPYQGLSIDSSLSQGIFGDNFSFIYFLIENTFTCCKVENV